MKYKNLYINGCSFTKGHHLPDEDTWPVKLAKELELELFNFAQNGQSMQSIALNSYLHLDNFDPKDTLVIIGITWPPRYSVQYKGYTFNMTPTGLDPGSHMDWEAKIARAGLPYYFLDKEDNRLEDANTDEGYVKVLEAFNEYYRSLVEYQDGDELFINQKVNWYYTIDTLRSCIKDKGFDCKFVLFPDDYNRFLEFKELDFTDIINLNPDFKKYAPPPNSHPTADGCTYIKDEILKVIRTGSSAG